MFDRMSPRDARLRGFDATLTSSVPNCALESLELRSSQSLARKAQHRALAAARFLRPELPHVGKGLARDRALSNRCAEGFAAGNDIEHQALP